MEDSHQTQGFGDIVSQHFLSGDVTDIQQTSLHLFSDEVESPVNVF